MYDYVLKIDPRNFEYIMSLLKRLKKNPDIKILVADNDLNYKNKIAKLLRIHKYKVYTASDGVKAKQILDKHPDIKMVLTEFKIPKIDGFALTYAIRENYKKEDMAVIGMTSSDDPILSTSFLKHGADDIVLEKVAGILRNRVRKSDLVARIGGEEFCFLAVNMKKKICI
ncbi:MAG: response regulator [Candidatus Firestonebacteria bacterium]|nr:response regulator [Candidatus Firestonebacteria bacterium]